MGEVCLAIQIMPQGQIPGPDGIPLEFFALFQDILVPTMTAAFNLFWSAGSLPSDFLFEGLILLHKKGNEALLHNKRPMTLLNANYKVFSKVWQLRLSPVAHSLISLNQSAFIPSQLIHHAVLLCLEILHRGHLTSTPLVFLQVDFKKACDKVKWGFLQELFAAMDFTPHFQLPLLAITRGYQS